MPKITGKNNRDDLLIGTSVAEQISGLGGNDTLIGNGGDDILDGGSGFDTAIYEDSVFGYDIDIGTGTIIDVDASDGDGGLDTLIGIEEVVFSDVTVYLDGRNNDPLISGAISSGSVTELAESDPAENAFSHGADGTIDFVEFDRTGSYTINVTDNGSGYRGSLIASLSDGDLSDGDGQVSWSFNVDDADIDDLSDGQTLTQTYDVAVDDGNGGVTVETITITITGSNDAPASIALTDDLVLENTTEVFIGNLSALDPDPADTVTFSIVDELDGALFELNGSSLEVGSVPLDYEVSPTRQVTIRATDSQGDFVDQTFTINVIDVSEITLTTGADVITDGALSTVFYGDATTVNAFDDLIAGDGEDKLILSSSGAYDFNSLVNFSGFDWIEVIDAGPTQTTLTMRDGEITTLVWLRTAGATQTVLVGTSEILNMLGGTGNDSVELQGPGNLITFQSGDGDDSVAVYGSGTVAAYDGGGGNDSLSFINFDAWNASLAYTGGAGSADSLTLAAAGTYDLLTVFMSGVEELHLNDLGVVAIVDNAVLTDVTSISSDSGSARIQTVNDTFDLTGKTVSGVAVESMLTDGTTFIVDDRATGLHIVGGVGIDTIQATGFAFTDSERTSIFDTTSIEMISDANGIFGNDDINTLQAGPAGGIVDGGGGDDTLIGGSGNDTFVFAPGDGTDFVTGFQTGAGSDDIIDLQAFDPVLAQTAVDGAVQVLDDTFIDLGNGQIIVLLDVTAASLHPDDFII